MLGAGVELVFPVFCAGCGVRGVACCVDCAASWMSPVPVSRGAAAEIASYALARYRGTARRLVLAYKERGRRDLARPLGAALAAAAARLPEVSGDQTIWLVPAPSQRAASRSRGGRHMLRLARECANTLAGAGWTTSVAPAVRLAGRVRDAVGLDPTQRMTNLAGRVRLDRRGMPPAGSRVLLLDDVLTTGATIAECARVLRAGEVLVSAALVLTAAG